MNDPLCTFLFERGEFLAAGFVELPDAPVVRRMGRGMRRHLEHCLLPEGPLQPLYPAGRYSIWDQARQAETQGPALRFHYSFPLNYNCRQSGTAYCIAVSCFSLVKRVLRFNGKSLTLS